MNTQEFKKYLEEIGQEVAPPTSIHTHSNHQPF
jgi:hypothetical protein